MEDDKIIDMFWERSETAINETEKKYSRYCYSISFNILHNAEDAAECVNDTYLRAWNSIPPNRPKYFSSFLGKITRNLSLDKFKSRNAEKRGFGQIEIALSELDECISVSNVEREISKTTEKELTELINIFLENLPKQKRIMFIQRYWYLMSVKTISEHSNKSESQVKSALFRIRKKLKIFLEKEGIAI